MKMFKNYILTALIIIGAVAACENVNEPYNIKGNELPAYVQFGTQDSTVTANEGETIQIPVEIPISIEEDVNFTYKISGDAQEGTDWTISGVSGNEGNGTITYDPESTNVDDASITINLPKDGTKDGVKTLKLTLTSAESASGTKLGAGQGDNEKRVYITILDFEDVPGTYKYTSNTPFGSPSGTVSVSRNSTDVNGTTYEYIISDFAAEAFGSPVPYPFNIDDQGNITAPSQYPAQGVAADITGTYSTTNGVKISMDVTLQCCGAAGATWNLDMEKQ